MAYEETDECRLALPATFRLLHRPASTSRRRRFFRGRLRNTERAMQCILCRSLIAVSLGAGLGCGGNTEDDSGDAVGGMGGTIRAGSGGGDAESALPSCGRSTTADMSAPTGNALVVSVTTRCPDTPYGVAPKGVYRSVEQIVERGDADWVVSLATEAGECELHLAGMQAGVSTPPLDEQVEVELVHTGVPVRGVSDHLWVSLREASSGRLILGFYNLRDTSLFDEVAHALGIEALEISEPVCRYDNPFGYGQRYDLRVGDEGVPQGDSKTVLSTEPGNVEIRAVRLFSFEEVEVVVDSEGSGDFFELHFRAP